LTQSDFVILAVPLQENTFHLINEDMLALMKPGGYLVNIGRGSVVDEHAVARALGSGRLAGYAADVFEIERLAAARPSRVNPPSSSRKPASNAVHAAPSWVLEQAPLGGNAFTTLASGNNTVANGVLANLDPGTLANGLYNLRLTATDISGHVSQMENCGGSG